MMKRWSVEQAHAWRKTQPWFFGANFIPSTAINQLEMWQTETFDPVTIERELGYAHGIGMNMMRVYLHDLLWEHDRDGFIDRIEQYLAIAESKGIKTMFTIFDDCWYGNAKLGPQPEPKPCVHNSGWLQSPGHEIAEDPSQWTRLERYVTELLEHFKTDSRIAVWDLYNEPGNGSAEDSDSAPNVLRGLKSLPLVRSVFEWARTVRGLTQPLTVPYWRSVAWPDVFNDVEEMNTVIDENCDIMSFHNYRAPVDGFTADIGHLQSFGRPVICTEYMGRFTGSTFENCLPILKEHGVGAINWGLVSGKTQTKYPWDWNEDRGEPPIWFHDVFNADGTFLCPQDEEAIRSVVESR